MFGLSIEIYVKQVRKLKWLVGVWWYWFADCWSLAILVTLVVLQNCDSLTQLFTLVPPGSVCCGADTDQKLYQILICLIWNCEKSTWTPLGVVRAAIQGYSFTSVSSPPTIRFSRFTPHRQPAVTRAKNVEKNISIGKNNRLKMSFVVRANMFSDV